MINLLIVDDDRDIGEGLMTTIKWRFLGVDCVETAKNGLVALNILREHPVEIVVTDVRMPGMDGIELAKRIHHEYPKTKVIILSGYSEFEYAKSAIEYGVDRYLLKPVVIRELIETVYKCIKEINRRALEEDKSSKIKDGFKILQEKFLLDVTIKGKTDPKELLEGFEKYHINQYEFPFVLVEIRACSAETVETVNVGSEKLKEYMYHILNTSGEYNFLLEDLGGKFYLVYKLNETNRCLPDVISKWKQELLEKNKVEVKIGVSETFDSLIHLSDAYNQIKTVMRLSFVDEDRSIFFYTQDIRSFFDNEKEYTFRQLLVNMNKMGEQITVNAINEFFRSIKGVGIYDEDIIKDLSKSLLDMVLQNCLQKGKNPQVYERHLKTQSFMKTCDKISHLHRAVLEFVEYVHDSDKDQLRDSKKRIVYEVKEYVNNNYFKGLDVNGVSSILKRSPNYLSHIFSDICGETFSEYLNKVRIEKAKNLLIQSDFTLYRIAKEVGYSDERYFIKIFKRITGNTPTQYRNSVLSSR